LRVSLLRRKHGQGHTKNHQHYFYILFHDS
jgi:hypothetical protein